MRKLHDVDDDEAVAVDITTAKFGVNE